MRTIWLVVLLAAFSWAAFAGTTTINFDDSSFFQGSDVGNFYQSMLPGGPSFATGDATILQVPNYNYSGYPPESYPNIIYSAETGLIDLTWTAGTVSDLSLYYVTYYSLTFSVYDSLSNLINTITVNPNTDGSFSSGTVVTIPGSGINSLVISGTSNFYGIDDISYNSGTVPEPGSMALLGLGMAGVAALLRRKQRKP